MTIRLQPKRPEEVREYPHDWSAFLGDATISGTPDTAATGVTLDSADVQSGNQSVILKVSGGTAGTNATITQTITTSDGRTETETFILPIRAVEEPVSLATAKAHLRVTDDSEDALIEAYITAAREWVENYTGHILVRRAMTQTFNRFDPYLQLHYRPIVSITGDIAYFDTDGVEQAFSDYTVAPNRYPYRIYPQSWPSTQDNSAVTVSFVAGYAEGEEPQALIQAMLLMIGHFYSVRAGVTDQPMHEVPLAVESLCNQFRSPVI